MSDVVHWVLAVNIKDGEYATFEALMGDMVTATQADEPGALAYEWYVSADKTSCHVYERYADSAAVMVHLGNFGAKFGARFMEILTPTSFLVYGPASDEVRGALGPMGAVHMDEVGGFAR